VPPAEPAEDRSRRPAIEERLRTAGLAPLTRTAWLEIDLDALASNLAVVRELAGPGVRVEPVVKADAYGHGAVPVALALEAAGVDGFSVATFDEAIELRDGGIGVPILVLYPAPAEVASAAAERGIALTVGDETLLERLLAQVTARHPRRPVRVAVEIETGLGRGGLDVGAAVRAVNAIRAVAGVELAGVWSHLAAPGDPGRSLGQVGRFELAQDLLGDGGVPVDERHLAASGGLLGGAAPSYEAVRPGLSLYGVVPEDLTSSTDIAPLPAATARLRPVMALRARAVRVTDLPAGHGVSYGPSFETVRPSRVATLPIGYADGWPRALSNRARALVRGLSVPLVGTVAMDAVMADVTAVPGAPVSVDDEFTLLGRDGEEQIDVLELARLRTTISWEVLSAMSGRLTRVYHRAAVPLAVRSLIDRRSVGPNRALER
jgi:alanine racemase